jgi:hypothetical protein
MDIVAIGVANNIVKQNVKILNERLTNLEQKLNTMFTDSSLAALKQIVSTGVTTLNWDGSKWIAQYKSTSTSSQSTSCSNTNNGDVYSVYNIILATNSMISNALKNTHTNPRILATLSVPSYSGDINPNNLDLMLSVALNSNATATLTRKGADIPHGTFFINWVLLADKQN